jgi:hypothetical protein
MVMVHGKRRKKIIILGCVISIVLLAAIIGAKLFIGHSDAPPLPQQIITQASFPLYYPASLPTGYALKVDSVVGDSNAIYYTLADITGKNDITVTLQATPASFDAAKIVGSNPIPTSITPVGTLYNLSIGGKSKYMLSTGKTLLFITSPKTIDGKTLNTLANSLAEIKAKQ